MPILHAKKKKQPNKRQLKGAASSSSQQPTVGCLFAAMGGFAKGFELAGARVLWANEKDRHASETFRANFPGVRHLEKPIEELSVESDNLRGVDVLTGGFPCQPFSIAGNKLGFQDERGLLFLHIIRLIKEFGKEKPKVLVLENVANFKSHDEGKTFRRVQLEIQKAGYWFVANNAKVLNTATHTNIPQNRSRVFMVAYSTDHFSANHFQFPEPMARGLARPVFDFLDLSHKQEDWYYFDESSQYYEPFKEAIAKNGKKRIYQLRRNYVRDNKSGQCFTLMANMGVGGHNEPVIKDRWGIRKLTPVECARLQGYDDEWFQFPEAVSRREAYKQVGNTVTVPLVARLAAECCSDILKARKR
jgi:DNA (cytosine-5)-methyltransferase 1